MHEVVAAGARVEVDRGEVDHDLVAGARRADQRDVGERGPALAAEADVELLHRSVEAAGRQHDPAAQAQHAAASSSSASATSSIPSSAATETRSVGSWLRSVPLARFTHGRPAASSALASEPPPLAICRGS